MSENTLHIGPINYEYLASTREFVEFTRLLQQCSNGVVMTLRDENGREGRGVFGGFGSPLCTLINSVPEGFRRCRLCDEHNLTKAAKSGKPLRYLCHAGIVDIAVPITVAGRLVANISSGQVLPEPHSRKNAERFVRRLSWLGVPAKQIRKAYWAAPYLDPDKLNATVDLLSFFSRFFCEAQLSLQKAIAQRQRPEITACRQYIDEHYAESLSLVQIAAQVQLSATHLSMLFHRTLGMTLTSYLQKRRITKASEYLRNSSQSITDICFACGFNSLTHFNRVFRKFYQCSPMQYRRRQHLSSAANKKSPSRPGD